MRRALGSVRARATLGATLVVAVALVAAGTAVLLSLWSNLSGQASTQAERTARAVAADLAAGTPYDQLSLDDDDRPVQVVDAAGRLVASSEDLERISGTGVEAVRPQAAAGQEEQEEGDDSLSHGEIDDDVSFTDGSATVDGDEADYRFAAVRVEADGDGTLTVYAGAPLSAEQSAVSTALTVMLIGFPLLLGVVAGVTWLVTRRALRPVEGIRAEMAEITASEDLARRVPVPDTHDEVARLARTTNETLAALETSVERQRRFVADASHELRSPIASLRTQLEVGAAHPELLDVEGAVEDTVRLQRLAADLLLLARLDAGERPADARFDLAEVVREQVEGRVGVTLETAVSVEVGGSRGQLGRLVANLLDNAQRHARSAVTVAVRREGSRSSSRSPTTGTGCPRRTGSGSSSGSCGSTTRAAGTTAAPGSDSPSPGMSPYGTAAHSPCVKRRQAEPCSDSACLSPSSAVLTGGPAGRAGAVRSGAAPCPPRPGPPGSAGR